MRLITVAAIVVLLATTCVPAPTPVDLEFGKMKVWLGMTRAELRHAADEAGYTFYEGQTNHVLIRTPDNLGCVILLKNGRLICANVSRIDWSQRRLEPVLEAMTKLNRQKCHVTVYKIDDDPSGYLNRTELDCGARTVVIEEGNMDGIDISDVHEAIGSAK